MVWQNIIKTFEIHTGYTIYVLICDIWKLVIYDIIYDIMYL